MNFEWSAAAVPVSGKVEKKRRPIEDSLGGSAARDCAGGEDLEVEVDELAFDFDLH